MALVSCFCAKTFVEYLMGRPALTLQFGHVKPLLSGPLFGWGEFTKGTPNPFATSPAVIIIIICGLYILVFGSNARRGPLKIDSRRARFDRSLLLVLKV